MLVQALFGGALDLIGDVHGEIEPLQALLAQLGYNRNGGHASGRRLVFVGDLIDRGPDSPAVVELVQHLVENGTAQCILGNHELNLLRGDVKHGNHWFLRPDDPEARPGGEFSHSRAAPDGRHDRYLAFFRSLPLVLERLDLRVVHAAWQSEAVDAIRSCDGTAQQAFEHFQRIANARLDGSHLRERVAKELASHGDDLVRRDAKMKLLEATGSLEEHHQMSNPVKVVTSGVERLAKAPFWASGKWRMCERVPWWEEYDEAPHVVVGHYWRKLEKPRGTDGFESKPELFKDAEPLAWVGKHRNVFCIDFSIGARYDERKRGAAFRSRMCAMRWPEKEVWSEQGRIGSTFAGVTRAEAT